jgi:hypothetical protein
MTARVKGILHGIINLVGNGTILTVLPDKYKPLVLLVFNIIQVVYAYLDPSYAYFKLGKGK